MLITRGYHYTKGEMNFYLPMIKRLLDPGFLANDWFLNLIPYHQNILWLIGKISLFFGLPYTVFGFYLLAGLLYLWGSYLVVLELTKNKNSSLTAMFVLALVIPCGIGGYFIFTDYFIPGVLAYALLIFSLYFFLREKYLWMFFCGLLAGKVHFLAGLNWLILIFPYYLYVVIKTKRYKECCWVLLLCLALFLPELLPLLKLQHGSATLQNIFLAINVNFRYPHHYLLTAHGFINILFLVAASVFVWRQARLYLQKKYREKIIYLVFGLVLFILINLFFVDLFPLVIVAKLQLLRLTFFLEYFFVIVFVLSVGEFLFPVLLLLPPLSYYFPEHTVHLVFLLLVLVYALLRGKKKMPPFNFEPQYLLLIMVIFLVFLNKNIFQKVSLSVPVQGDPWFEVCAAAKQISRSDALFLIPPDQEGFRMFAERAVVVDFKACPYLERDSAEWLDRLSALTGIIPGELDVTGFAVLPIIAAKYDRSSWSKIQALAKQYRVSFVITRTRYPGKIPIYNNKTYYIYKI